MKANSINAALIVLLFSCKEKKAAINQNTELIFPKEEKITNNNFVGNAWFQQLVMPDSLNPTQVGNVTFAPGARSNWHHHPGGRILLVLDGVG